MYHSPQGPELVPVELALGANLPSPAESPPPLQSPERSSCWQAAVAMTSRRRTACLIWLITGKIPGVHTDVLLPQSGGKELTLLEYSLFSRVLSRPPDILAVTRADGQHHRTVTGEETEAETEGLAQGQDRRVSECMLGGITIARSLGVQLLLYGCLIYSAHLPIPSVTPTPHFL